MAANPKFIELKARLKVRKDKKKNLKIFDVSFDSWTCQSANGTYEAPTTAVASCYFQNVNGGPQYPGVVTNDDPIPGTWHADGFQALPGNADYNLYAVGDDDLTHPTVVGPIHCA